MNRKVWSVVLVLGTLVLNVESGRAQEGQHPNLVPMRPYDVQIGPADDSSPFEPRKALRFTVAIANRDAYPFDILGVPTTEVGVSDARQCTRWVKPTHRFIAACSKRTSVGTIRYHDAHNHWHLDRFVTYELRRLDDAGDPIMTPDGLTGESRKVSFCLLNSEADDEPDPEGSPRLAFNTYNACTAGSMGISPGARDVYDYYLADQQLLLEGVADGDYAIVIHVNPDGKFFESNVSDDMTYTRLTLTEGAVEVWPAT